MNKSVLWIITAVIIGIISLAVWQYLLVVYEVKILVEPEELFADNSSTCTIRVIPLNSFGKPAPFRNAGAKFEFESGKDLVVVINENEDDGYLKLRALLTDGQVVIFVRPEYSLLPTKVIIPINKNFT